ncbi:FAD-dependent oxidoreductase [Sphingomonas astaxanthinifaciens]|uniref:Monooxygenase n=1 Tax=Sphingomonas astaxanthinifaciens DSM 22298 TaxID=1123267 RepID=A0ABQ5Z928_9SPHN|nr:FAD-dependent oxidoreductase [Sphingomonas astaxanthinifaciens]GLR47986.1 monooxygenase [Sphingomonas astaxanthinifaciens DSM 22298]
MTTRDLIVVGGGPAGVMTGLLFARAGCTVSVLEKHADFFRDFRGDTVHPSTMEILSQLGWLEDFLKRPHHRLDHAELRIAGRDWTIGDLSHLDTPAPFIAMMPQWEFLDFLRTKAAAFPGFALEMGAAVADFLEEDGRVSGVRLADGSERRARLVIAADGRSSLVRQKDMLPLEVLGAPMDVFWFRVPKTAPGSALRGSVERGRLLVMIDRGDYWQCAFLIPKGKAADLLAGGIGPIRAAIAEAAPELDLADLDDVADLKLLSVSLDRLTAWQRPGLLAIGDAAHAMSPIGGVGINLAIQDAVAAANLLAGPLAAGARIDPLLHKVEERRLLPTRLVQSAQKTAQDRVIGRLLEPGPPLDHAPWLIRLLDKAPLLRRIPGRMIGLGIRREKVESPAAQPA